uniref:hypothetical protein n=1 Tax=Staphylococcus epidermidis TaxID=1282 RepID=UPI00247A2800|nr:hypothetical protein [Staphylococcus epidermidis]
MKGGDVVLTNEAEFVLLQLYRCYEDDLQDGKNKSEARYFEDEHSVRDNYFIGIDSEDFHLALKELSSYGYLNTPKSTMNGYPEFILEPSAIAEMQNRYTKNLNKVLKRINELKKLILF